MGRGEQGIVNSLAFQLVISGKADPGIADCYRVLCHVRTIHIDALSIECYPIFS